MLSSCLNLIMLGTRRALLLDVGNSSNFIIQALALSSEAELHRTSVFKSQKSTCHLLLLIFIFIKTERS